MNRLARILILLAVVLLLAGAFPLSGRAAEQGDRNGSPQASAGETSGFNPGLWLVTFFRDTISPVDGDRCPSAPSCSSYSVQCFQKHGFFMGWMMTVDRLIHEGREETTVSPVVYSEGRWKIYDPVANNDFWWYPAGKKVHE